MQDGGAVNPKKHIITVSTYQMCILLLFNKKEKVTFEVSNLYFKLICSAVQSQGEKRLTPFIDTQH